jgi:uncharacterized protein YjiS (DUF1127 family)
MREAASFIARQSGSAESGMLQEILHAAQRTFRAWRNRQRIASLSDFDDHILSDMGLTRGDVRQALDVPFTHDPASELQRLALRNRSSGWNA